jgi:hypothetical protein
MTDKPPDPTTRFFAAAQMAVGALIFGLCGACTLGFTAAMLANLRYSGSLGEVMSSLLMFAIVGGLPTVVGFFVMRGGYRRYRANPPKPPKPPPSAQPPG